MKRLISLSKKSLSLENGSGMTREWLGIASARPFTVLVLFLMLFSFGVVNAWGTDLNSSLTYTNSLTHNSAASSDAIGTYFTATWEQTSAQTAPVYWNSGSDYGVKMYVQKNATTGNTLTISTSTPRVYITGITITGKNAKGSPALYWQGSTSNTGTSKTFDADDKIQSVAIRLKETGNSNPGQYIVKTISIDYVVVTNVTLDKNGGDSDGSIVVTYNETAGADFSAASRAGYTCTGYYTASSDGTKVLNDDGTFAGNVSGWITSSKWSKSTNTATLYAQWVAAGCSNYSFLFLSISF